MLAPIERDGSLVCQALGEAGLETVLCADVDELCARIRDAEAAVLAEEALSEAARRRLSAALAEEPAWSNFPLLLLVPQTRADSDAWQALEGIEHTSKVTLLERPLRAATLVSAARVAVQSRQRQYQVRDELAARARAEKALEEVNRRLEALMQALPVGVSFSDDTTCQRITGNPEVLAHFEITSADNLSASAPSGTDAGRQIRYFADGRPLSDAELPMQRAVAENRTIPHMEMEVRLPSGRTWIAQVSGAPVRDAEGNVVGGVAVTVDVTERRRIEEALRRSEEDLKRAQAVAHVGSWWLDIARNDLKWSEETHRIFGMEAGTPLTYETFLDAVHPDDRAWVAERWSAALHGAHYDIEHRIVARGRVKWVRQKAQLEFDRQGSPVGGFGTVQDISERKQAEVALRELNESLERRVAERTALAERRARHLRRLAAELGDAEHRERRRLSKLLHDDLQQLLLAAKLRLSTVGRGDAEQLQTALGKVEQLLAECLRTSRSLTHELSPPILHCGTLAEAIEWLGGWFWQTHELDVGVDAEEELPRVPEHVRVFLFHAVRELLANVIKHSGVMEARVELAARPGSLVVRVEDAGKGFDPEEVEYQLDRPESFGLFNIRERLEALGGRLEVRSTPGGGASFSMIVPVAAAEPTPAPTADAAREAAHLPVAEPRRAGDGAIRLLVVDDHAVVRMGLVTVLGDEPDFDVVGEAADGLEAIRKADAVRPDVILMDVEMPRMGGVEAARQIKERQPGIRIIGLSMHDEDAVVRAMLDAGASTYLCKHNPAENLVEAVRRVCRGG